MGNLTITIERNNGVIDIRYSPSQKVSRGGTVTFVIRNIAGDVDVSDVTYDSSPVGSSPVSCFSQPGPYTLNGDNNPLLTASLPETVTTNAPLGWYHFTVSTSDRTERRRKGEELETKTGSLEVSPDEW